MRVVGPLGQIALLALFNESGLFQKLLEVLRVGFVGTSRLGLADFLREVLTQLVLSVPHHALVTQFGQFRLGLGIEP